MLGTPTRLALRWDSAPAFYRLSFPGGRRSCIESAYGALNAAHSAAGGSPSLGAHAVACARRAFAHNAAVYAGEQPSSTAAWGTPRAGIGAALVGVANVAGGLLRERVARVAPPSL